MSDVFISYSKKDRAVAEALARDLQERGIDVWWDFDLYAGEDFHDVILAQLERAKAVIVIWSEDSVQSKWVRGEADEALEDGKLIATHVGEFARGKVPLNFRGVHREDVEDRDRILRSLQRKGVAVNPIGGGLPGYVASASARPSESSDGMPGADEGVSPETDEVIWYIGREGEQHGPLSDDEMAEFHNRGYLRANDLVWKPDMSDWTAAAQLFEFGEAGVVPESDRVSDDPSTWGKVASDEQCPCGSGKKYKHCHWGL